MDPARPCETTICGFATAFQLVSVITMNSPPLALQRSVPPRTSVNGGRSRVPTPLHRRPGDAGNGARRVVAVAALVPTMQNARTTAIRSFTDPSSHLTGESGMINDWAMHGQPQAFRTPDGRRSPALAGPRRPPAAPSRSTS